MLLPFANFTNQGANKNANPDCDIKQTLNILRKKENKIKNEQVIFKLSRNLKGYPFAKDYHGGKTKEELDQILRETLINNGFKQANSKYILENTDHELVLKSIWFSSENHELSDYVIFLTPSKNLFVVLDNNSHIEIYAYGNIVDALQLITDYSNKFAEIFKFAFNSAYGYLNSNFKSLGFSIEMYSGIKCLKEVVMSSIKNTNSNCNYNFLSFKDEKKGVAICASPLNSISLNDWIINIANDLYYLENNVMKINEIKKINFDSNKLNLHSDDILRAYEETHGQLSNISYLNSFNLNKLCQELNEANLIGFINSFNSYRIFYKKLFSLVFNATFKTDYFYKLDLENFDHINFDLPVTIESCLKKFNFTVSRVFNKDLTIDKNYLERYQEYLKGIKSSELSIETVDTEFGYDRSLLAIRYNNLNLQKNDITLIIDSLKKIIFELQSEDINIVSDKEFGYLSNDLRFVGSGFNIESTVYVKDENMLQVLASKYGFVYKETNPKEKDWYDIEFLSFENHIVKVLQRFLELMTVITSMI